MRDMIFESSEQGVALEGILDEPSATPRGLAVIAHPYGFLGGSLADGVVKAVRTFLLSANFRVVRFNSRGVGRSGGKASWTGRPEADDFRTVAAACATQLSRDHPTISDATLLLVGYSAGAMYSSATTNLALPAGFQPTVHHLLVSYPLDMLWALSMFGTSHWKKLISQLCCHPDRKVLFVQGDADQFTKSRSYETWFGQLATAHGSESRSDTTTIPGADHFWRGSTDDTAHIDTMLRTIKVWLPS